MTIRQNIEQVIQDITADPDLSERLREQAVAAIHAGGPSTAWNTYMENFAGHPINPVQLARLTGVDDTPCNPENPYVKPARAYLIANGTCGTPTFKNYLLGITDHFDVTLPAPQPETTPSEDK